MSRSIIVVGNCQTGGIAAALQYLFPSDRIKALPIKSNILNESLNRIRDADVVVALPQLKTMLSRQGLPLPRQFIDIPGFY